MQRGHSPVERLTSEADQLCCILQMYNSPKSYEPKKLIISRTLLS